MYIVPQDEVDEVCTILTHSVLATWLPIPPVAFDHDSSLWTPVHNQN